MGFVAATGPQIEDDYHCFSALNLPENHPARQMQDTFYMPNAEDGKKMVLRTQTSSVQIRFMEMKENKPPFKFFALAEFTDMIMIQRILRCFIRLKLYM